MGRSMTVIYYVTNDFFQSLIIIFGGREGAASTELTEICGTWEEG